jgi:predicted transcriptional regulator
MIDNDQLLISLNHCHAKNIYAGIKTVEFRRRTMHILPGSIIWIYEKVPIGSITGYATVKAIRAEAPELLWEQYNSISGLRKSEFFEYFSNIAFGCAIELMDVQPLAEPIRLKSLREKMRTFQPPQFFTRIKTSHPLYGLLKSGLLDSRSVAATPHILLVA